MIQPEEELFSCLQAGNERGYGKLVETFRNPVFLYAKSIVGNTESAQEIINDVFIKLWDQRTLIKVSSSMRSYLFRMVHNAGIDYLRTRKKTNESSLISVEEIKQRLDVFEIPDSENQLDGMFSEQFEKAFLDELVKLPTQCREIFMLCRTDQLSYPEIADRLNVSVSTVKTQMVRAMVKLKEGLKDYL